MSTSQILGASDLGTVVDSRLAALSIPLWCSPDMPAGFDRWKSRNVEQILREGLSEVAALTAQHAYDLVLDRVNRIISDVTQIDCMHGKTKAVLLYCKATALQNCGKLAEARELLDQSLGLLTSSSVRDCTVEQSIERFRENGAPWVLNPHTPVSPLDIWHIKTRLIEVDCDLSMRLGRQTHPISQRITDLFEEMKDYVASPLVCGMYSDLASYYATFLCKSVDRDATATQQQALRLREQAFKTLKANLPPDDSRVLHKGIELVEALVQQVYLRQAATLIREIQPYAKSEVLPSVDLLVAKSGVCIGLLGLMEISRDDERPSVFIFDRKSQEEIVTSCASLGIKVVFSAKDWKQANRVQPLMKQLAKQAEAALESAENLVQGSPEDPLLQDRAINVFRRRATLAAVRGDDRTCDRYAELVERLLEERKQRSQR